MHVDDADMGYILLYDVYVAFWKWRVVMGSSFCDSDG